MPGDTLANVGGYMSEEYSASSRPGHVTLTAIGKSRATEIARIGHVLCRNSEESAVLNLVKHQILYHRLGEMTERQACVVTSLFRRKERIDNPREVRS